MQNSSSAVGPTKNTKFEFLKLLVRECYYFTNITHSQVIPDQKYNENGSWCPRLFDGFACWDQTPAATVAVQNCPEFIIGFDPRLPVYKRCTENGTWMQHPDFPESKKPWTNYTSCVDLDDLDFRTNVNSIYVIGYSISVAALLLSLAIFMYFRSLQCTRIRIHMHLFSSFTLNNILWIIWYKVVVDEVTVVQENKEWCQVLHIITNYFMVTSYFWMFCEGLHLHIALVVVFVKDKVALRWFVALGWGLSLLVVLVYAIVRYFYGSTERCWMDISDTFWIIIVPVVISLFTSFIFLINVVRVLLTKLHPTPNQHTSLAAKKATRATLLLIPLFGLHFVLIPLHPAPESPLEKVYQIVSALLTSLQCVVWCSHSELIEFLLDERAQILNDISHQQGLCVAVLFCFTNHDVTAATKTQWARALRRHDGIPMTGITGGESMNNTRENVV